MNHRKLNIPNQFKKAWDKIENEKTLPRRMRNTITVSYEELKNKIIEQSQGFVTEIVQSLYDGDVYLVKGAFSKEFILDLIKKAHE